MYKQCIRLTSSISHTRLINFTSAFSRNFTFTYPCASSTRWFKSSFYSLPDPLKSTFC